MVALLQSIPQIPIAKWVNSAISWIIGNFGGAFDVLNSAIEGVVSALSFLLTVPPTLVMIVILAVIAFFLSGWRIALFAVLGLLLVVSLGLWSLTMTTLSLILVATTVCLAIGIPIGILAAKSQRLEEISLPVLDLMQTMPAFVYLVLAGSRRGAGPARDGHLCHAARSKADHARHTAGPQGDGRGRACLRFHPHADALQGGVAALIELDQGRG